MQIEISKRKLESYKRAEAVAQEVRWMISHNTNPSEKLVDLVIHWMKVTGNKAIFTTPERPGN